MGLFDWLFRLFGFPPQPTARRTTTSKLAPESKLREGATRGPLPPLRYAPKRQYLKTLEGFSGKSPYRHARLGSVGNRHLDLSTDGNTEKLQSRGLPVFWTPQGLADWLEIPLKDVAWLIHRCQGERPFSAKDSHYHYRWIAKRSGGSRLIEAPKTRLKSVQRKILHEILNRVAPHSAAHGFVSKRSIVTNSLPHVGQQVVLKMDLKEFYPSVTRARVVAIFRSLGYSREAAIWLAALTTTATPGSLRFPDNNPYALTPYLRPHLPQGAPTSPALANLSAFSLDVRLSGLCQRFKAHYTRYADDLTFSGDKRFEASLKVFLPLVRQVLIGCRFSCRISKTRVLRASQCQSITGVVVNERANVSRRDFDRLKAVLHNCVTHGPASQNRENLESFSAHLAGRIAHVQMLNPKRANHLRQLYARIDWRR